jgi:alpha-beta hydrolase superfamily lysophospholipase
MIKSPESRGRVNLFRMTKQRVVVTVAVVVTVLGILVFGASWYYSGLIEDGAFKIDREVDELDLEVVSVSANQISFKHPSTAGRWVQPGIWGFEWDDGFARVGDLLSNEDDLVTREFSELNGRPTSGTSARMTREVFSTDPLVAHAIPFREVTFLGALSPLGAWLIDDGDTWVIHVHGHAGDRIEALRSIPAIARSGLSSLAIDYRNDEGVAEDPSGYYLYGATEWQDLEAAVQYALDQGAESVIPYGYSMGGAIVMSFLYNSPLASNVSGVVLDAPMLDLSRVIDQAAAELHVPGFITYTARFIAEQRFDIKFDDMAYLEAVGQLTTPVLLFHGDDDDRIPVETSDELAEARPDLVTYERVPEAKHVHAWNIDEGRYESALELFLRSVVRAQRK